jgi:hypothetical protein
MTVAWQVTPHRDAGEDEGPGQFRRHDIRPFGGGMTPPSWALVEARLQDWIHKVNDAEPGLRVPKEEPLPESLARLHNSFEQVHPFIDGNGRAGRLILNLTLVRLGYPPATILTRQREAPLAAMRRADEGDPGPLGELLARAMYDNLNRFIVPNGAGPARLVPLTPLVDTDFSLVALRAAARPTRCSPRNRRSLADFTQGHHGIQEEQGKRFPRQ